jgi:hypothetical protein
LGFGEPADGADGFAGREIDDAKTVVAEFGDEQPLMRDIDRHVIDASAHRTKGNLTIKPQKLHSRRRLGRRGYRQDQRDGESGDKRPARKPKTI